ncbi:MAG: LacI family DNA-binding transcriptional regulator, partial [Spirochaetia bacterium]|nr:LacI family DNA-binding transcriptional regulator [Spirochaetia bacterium]
MIKKIASTLNVSVSTVRRALGDFPDIGAETKERVKKTASDMGYRPDFLARAMITKKTLLIGLIVPEFDSTFFPRVISSVEGCAAKNGYRILIAKHDYSQEKFHAAVQTFSQYRVDGLILSPPEKELAESTRKEIRELARPVVFFDDDCPGEGLAWVGTDDIRAGEMAASYVVDCGFRRPAFTGRNTRSTSAQDRLDGFEKKLGGENIFLNPTFIFSGDFSEKTGEASAETILRSPGKPDVVFCANDQIAAGLMMKLREGGLR